MILHLYSRDLLKDDPFMYVPEVIPELSSKGVLCTEFIQGIPVDKCLEMDQDVKNKVKEFFVFGAIQIHYYPLEEVNYF